MNHEAKLQILFQIEQIGMVTIIDSKTGVQSKYFDRRKEIDS